MLRVSKLNGANTFSSPTYVFYILSAVSAFFFLMHWGSVFSNSFLGSEHILTRQLVKLFWLDKEYNLPSWFSSSILWTSGVLLLIVPVFVENQRSKIGVYWFALGLIFVCLSADEAIAVHEWLIAPIRTLLNTNGFFYFAWIIPAMIALTVGFLGYIPFLRQLPGKTRSIFLLSAFMYVGGAIGMEMIGGAAATSVIEPGIYRYAMPIEELLEMLAISLFIFGILEFILVAQKGVQT